MSRNPAENNPRENNPAENNPAEVATTEFLGFQLLPVAAPRARRMSQLLLGLVLFGVALGLAVQALLGTNPWVVFAQGLENYTSLSLGALTVLIGAAILVFLWMLREPLGIGTVLNVLIIGPMIDVTTWLLPDSDALAYRIPLIILSPVLLGYASGLYLGAGVGPGPRDGLMTAMGRRGMPIWLARTALEATVLVVGWILGGDVGFGTVWIAITIGPLVQFFLRYLRIDAAPQMAK